MQPIGMKCTTCYIQLRVLNYETDTFECPKCYKTYQILPERVERHEEIIERYLKARDIPF